MRQLSVPILRSILSLTACVGLPATVLAQGPSAADQGRAQAPRIPIFFVEIPDQGPTGAKFAGRSGGLNVLLHDDRIALPIQGECQQAAVSLRFDGAVSTPLGGQFLPGKLNVLVGDEANWRSGIDLYGAVEYRELWPGIDLVMHGNGGELEYDFQVSPGADLAQVSLRVEGAESITLGADGAMVIGTAAGDLHQKPPRTWEVAADGSRVFVPAVFELRPDGSFGFLVERQDESRPLVVDPVLLWSTYFGTNGESEYMSSMAVDDDGAVYIAGMAGGALAGLATNPMLVHGDSWPIGDNDGYVAKLDPRQSGPAQLAWLTVIGGKGRFSNTPGGVWRGVATESIQAIALRPSGNVVLAGVRTDAAGQFPLMAGDNDDPLGLNWLGELSPDGASLVHGFRFGANPMGKVMLKLFSDGRVLWSADNAYVGCPTTPGAFQQNVSSPADGTDLWFGVFDFDSSSASHLLWATYFGGTSSEKLAGTQQSATEPGVFTFSAISTFPAALPHTHASGATGFEDSVVGRFDTTQTGAAQMRFAHQLGDLHTVSNVAVDSDGTTWMVGYRRRPDYNWESGVLRLAADGSSVLEDWGFSWGTFPRSDVHLSTNGTLTVVGISGAVPVTPDAMQPMPGGNADVAVVQLDLATRQVTYGTYWGGSDTEDFSTGCSHLSGNVLTIGGSTRSRDIPLVNAYKTDHIDSWLQASENYVARMTLPGDTDPPVVTITAPADGTITGAAAVFVSADVVDESSTSVASAPAGLTPDTLAAGGGTVTGILPLSAEGPNTLAVSALDAYGNPSATSIVVHRDSLAPLVSISPAEGTIVSTPLPSFGITVTDQTLTVVSIDGNSVGTADVDGGGAYGVSSVALTGSIALWHEGANSIVVQALDAAGNLTSVTRTVILDSTAPIVEITTPVNGECYGSGSPSVIPLIATVSDASPTEVSGALSGSLPAGGGTLLGTFALQEGVNVITVIAENPGLGLSSSDTISVTLDTLAPTVAITSPGDGTFVRGIVEFHATVGDVLPGTVASSTYFVDDVALAPSGLYLVDTNLLPDGPHALRVDATDSCGNLTSTSITVHVDNTSPTLSITNPVDLATVAGTIGFDASASDVGSGLVEITMTAADAAPTTDGSQSYALPQAFASVSSLVDTLLALGGLDGDLELEVSARDSAGNSTTVSLTVHVSNAVSEATITSPADGAVVRCVIQVKANVSVPNLASVEFVIGGVGLPYFCAPPYELDYDTRNRLDGELPILLRATDIYGNVTTSAITVVVDNLEVKIMPETLELKSKGGDKSVTAKVEGQSAHLLWLTQPTQITLCVPGGSPIPATLVHGQHLGWRCFFEHHPWHRGRRHGHEHGCHGNESAVLLKFNRQLLIGALRGAGLTNGKVEMTIKVVAAGQTFVIGSDFVRVKSH